MGSLEQQPIQPEQNNPRVISRRGFLKISAVGFGIMTGLLPGLDTTTVHAATPEPTGTSTPFPTEIPTSEQNSETTSSIEPVKLDKICTDWRKVETEGTILTLEDVTSGALTEAAKLAAKELGMETFPPEAYATGMFEKKQIVFSGLGGVKYVWYEKYSGKKMNPFYTDYQKNPKHRPYRWVMFNKMAIPDYNANDCVIATQQWLNPSGKVSFLHYIIENSKDNQKETFSDMHFGFPIYEDLIVLTDEPEAQKEREKYYGFIGYNTRDIQKSFDSWIQTGEIPDELQLKLMAPITFDPRME